MSPRDPLRLPPGTVVDGFTVAAELPAGGPASLWRVECAGAPFPMVLKVPRTDVDDPTLIARIENERLVLPRVGGAHAPAFVAAGEVDRVPYLVTELVAGRPLHDRTGFAPLSAEETAWVGARLAEALDDLHRRGVAHLDLKPRSVLLRQDGTAVLVDFGLARHAGLPDPIAGQFPFPVGTAAFIAPEQVLRVRSDPRSDLFALGVILYQLATGALPFGSPTSLTGLRRRLYQDPVPPRHRTPSCPPWLQEVILGCLEVDPRHRPADAAAVARMLRDPASVRVTRTMPDRPPGPLAALVRRLRRHPGPAGAAPPAPDPRPGAAVPTVMAAVDLTPGAEPLAEALRAAVRRTYEYRRAVRLACVTVRTLLKVGVIDATVDSLGRDVRAQRLAELKHWALPLGLPPDLVSYHVLEAADTADAIVGFARESRVDHLVVGARGSSQLRRILGSVSSRVVAEAPCTVTVVRPHRAHGPQS